ncbi:hypothetical protein [Yersinia phage MHG19]|nr:hypothetical protein [Yersinia phage MHG19]
MNFLKSFVRKYTSSQSPWLWIQLGVCASAAVSVQTGWIPLLMWVAAGVMHYNTINK